MANLYDKASLVLPTSPAYKDGAIQAYKPLTSEGTFDFSRGSNLAATRVNADRLIEKGRENLLLQSNQFDTTWVLQAASITGGQSDKDGGTSAWLLENNTGVTNTSLVYQTASYGSSIYSFSVYAKAGTTNWLRIVTNDGTNHQAWFNLTDGSVWNETNIIDAYTQSVGNGWYRVNVASQSGATSMRIFPVSVAGSGLSDAGDNIYIQDAQLEQGLVATDYIETGASTAQAGILEDMPRLDYSGDATCPALLLEPQRSNVITQSEASTEWITTRARNEIGFTSPEGVDNATKVIPNTDNDDHYTRLTDSISQSFTNGTTYTISFYVKAAEHSSFELALVGLGVTTAQVDLSDESHNVGELEDAGNGWYRFYYTFTADNTSAQIRFFPNTNNNFVGNDSDGILIYGAQLEAGSYPTSYIPTYGTSVTRNGDSCVATSVEDLIGQTEGTFFAEFEYNGFNGAISQNAIYTRAASSTSNYMYINVYNGRINIGLRVNSTTLFDTLQGPSPLSEGVHKCAFAYKSGDIVIYLDGQSIYVPSNNVYSNLSLAELGVGNNTTGGNQLGDGLKQVIVFKTRLSNEELAALTTI